MMRNLQPTHLALSRRTLLTGALATQALAKLKIDRRMGLELYSLRTAAEKNLPATLRLIHELGFREVEVSELLGRKANELRRILKEHGLRATSIMAEYRELFANVDAVAANAKQLGAEYVVCSTIPHERKYLSNTDCDRAAPKLNQWGERLLSAGLQFCYHTHGTEFQAFDQGTVFDALVQKTDRRYVNFEMDIFWIVYAHQDPAALLRRYPGRFSLMHVKDIRKGTVLGGTPAEVREEDSVPLGTGIVNIPDALNAAEETGVRRYYIEDEAVDAEPQLRDSLRYLKHLRL